MQTPQSRSHVSFPPPSAEALAHSAKLSALIRRDIVDRDGWIPFERYMQLALYAPGLGYYSAGAKKIGKDGDFVTAPEISALYGQSIARSAAEVIANTDGDILEFGAGSGRLAFDLLDELQRLRRLPRHYYILEVSADLRERQQSLLASLPTDVFSRIKWIDELFDAFSGLVIGNEVLDAMPTHLLVRTDNRICERGVAIELEHFVFHDRAVDRQSALFAAADKFDFPENYVSEINLAAQGFIASLGAMLQRGVLLMIDYGFSAAEYYHPQRSMGTLMCHYRHHAHNDPFYLPGLQDITSHVDFSAIAKAGQAAGLELIGFTSQAQFLLDCGITDLIARHDPSDAANYLPMVNALQRLVSPAEMGELFKAIAMGKNFSISLPGFNARSLRL
ncbi:MAG: class I SAM-dependent methyltransferase [Burkholderiales bacterium]